MTSCRTRVKLSNFLTFSCLLHLSVTICFPLFSCLVVASSELDPSPNSNSVTSDQFCKNIDEIPCRKDGIELQNSNFDLVLLSKQQKQLEKLEKVVKNLNELVSRLESRLVESPGSLNTPPSSTSSSHSEIRDYVNVPDELEDSDGKKIDALDTQKMGIEPGVVTKYSTFWSEKFHFVSAVKLSSLPTCVNLLPFRDFEGLIKYFAVGDNLGKIYVFYRSGDVSLEFNTEHSSPITTVVSYLSVYKNESMIITGHENGVLVVNRVWEVPSGDESSLLQVERVRKFELPDGDKSGINLLTVHNVGRRRHILATNRNGKIVVFREDGTVHGAVSPSSKPVTFLKQRLMFLTETGAGSLDLRTMKIKESECEGLNSSLAMNYVLDVMDRSKAYGTTSEGELVQTLVLGDTINFKCRVRSKRKLDLDGPLALQAVKGYLLISNKDKVSVYNISSQQYVRSGGVRHLFSTEVDEILSSFLHQKTVIGHRKSALPLLTSDYDKHVVISLGNGYVAMFRSNLPVFKNEFNSILWTSPVLFFILFLFGAWHFFANKKEVLTSWGPDDPFGTSTTPVSTNGAATQLDSNASERLSNDNARSNSEIMELRGSGMRDTSRYVSPPRYSGGGAGNSYVSGSDPDSRPFNVENRFRTTGSELKFRGLDGDKRREGLYANNQVVENETN